jgi:SulP family sulfate permease
VSFFSQYFKKAVSTTRAYNKLDFFPLRSSLAGYRGDFKAHLTGDLHAGINTALLAFPQGIAYAMIAGLPIHYGIYGSAVASIIAAFFARGYFITLGPTNATSVILLSTLIGLGIKGTEMLALLPLLILMIGLVIVIGAYFRIANFVPYISRSVITGYITAAALLIIANQVPRALGLDSPGKGATFYESVRLSLSAIDTVNWPTVVISISTIVVYLLLVRFFKKLPNVAICLVLSCVTQFFIGDDTGVVFLSSINPSEWSFEMPSFKMEHIQLLISPSIAIALLCILESISIGKSLAAKTGSRLDTNQEMFAIGMANIGCAFFSGMPASGSLTRSALNVFSGARTVLASLISGLLILVGAFVIGPYTHFIPQCTLSVLIITIGIPLINKHAIKIVTYTTKSDAVVFISTFLCGLFIPLNSAIYAGVGVSIVLFLKKVAQPEMVEYTFNDQGQLAEMEDARQRHTPEISIVHVEGQLFFGAADLFRDQMRRICEDPNLKIVILKMRSAQNMDATAVMALEELLRYMSEKKRYLILSEVKKDTLQILKKSGLYDYIEERNIFTYEPSNPTLSTARALKRATEHLGNTEANVSIYVNPHKDDSEEESEWESSYDNTHK